MADNPAATKHRNTKVGQVVSRSGNKSVVVEVTRRVQHPLYKRFINKSKKFYAHDEQNQCQLGDTVRIVETRPLSKLKRWRLEQIVHRSALAVMTEATEAASTESPTASPEATQESAS
jgi:small subunit ribosomal protein S17